MIEMGQKLPYPAKHYQYVCLQFEGKWVIFHIRLEQEGYPHMGMFLGSFFNMGTIFNVQIK